MITLPPSDPTGHHIKDATRSPYTAFVLSAIMAVAMMNLPGTLQVQADEATRLAHPEAVTVRAIASTASVRIAEPFTLELTVIAEFGTKISLPPVGQQLGDFEVIDHRDIGDIPSENSTAERVWTRRLTLESIVAGDLLIPVMEIGALRGSDSWIVQSQAIPIRVLSVLEDRADPTQFRDIQSVVDVNVPGQKSYDWLWQAGGGLGLLAIVSAGIAVVARRRKWLTPNQWALRELGSLQGSMAMRAADSQQVSMDLTSILRGYLELQFQISAPMQTTEELMLWIGSQRLLEPETATRFSKAFQTADLTKFAGLQLSPAELSDAISEARELIIQTARDLEPRTKSTALTEAN